MKPIPYFHHQHTKHLAAVGILADLFMCGNECLHFLSR